MTAERDTSDESIEWEITVDRRDGLNGMRTERTVRRRYFTVRLWHAWLIILALCAGTWAGIFMLGFWVAGWAA